MRQKHLSTPSGLQDDCKRGTKMMPFLKGSHDFEKHISFVTTTELSSSVSLSAIPTADSITASAIATVSISIFPDTTFFNMNVGRNTHHT